MNILHSWKQQELKKVNAMIELGQQRFTLTDGNVILIYSQDNQWAGKLSTDEENKPLTPGEYRLAGSMFSNEMILTVGKEGIIKKVRTL